MRAGILLALLLLGAAPAPQTPAPVAPAPVPTAVPEPAPPVAAAVVVARLPHDPRAFTEGLFYRDGAFFEATGEVGRSFIRKVDPATGRVLKSVTIAAPYFGEGIAPVGNQIVSLTWQHHIGFRWTIDGFRKVGSFSYPGEGWALTGDGRELVMSDGTAALRFLDPRTMAERRRLAVTYRGRPLAQLNELEWVDGEILANVWHTDAIVRIDPASGKVVGVIDLSALTAEVHPTEAEAVPNGIAWDAAHRRLFVTGKDWPVIFEIAPPSQH